MSEFDDYFRLASAPSLVQHFGNAAPPQRPVWFYEAPGNNRIPLPTVIEHIPEAAEDFTADDATIKQTRMRLEVPRALLDAFGIHGPQYNATLYNQRTNERWAINLEQTKFGPGLATLGLERDAQTRPREPRGTS